MTEKMRCRRIVSGAVTSVVLVAISLCGLLFAVPPSAASAANTSENDAWNWLRPATSDAQVLGAVKTAQNLQTLPNNVQPGLTVTTDGAGVGTGKCPNTSGVMALQGCAFGDLKSKKLMVVYGDSHAAMWAEALQIIAKRTGWKLVVFAFPGCPLPDLQLISAQTNGPNTQCQQFHMLAVPAIKKLHPNVLIVTSESTAQTAVGVNATPTQWQSGLMKSFASLSEPGTTMVMIGDIPQWPLDDADCLAAHMTSVQNCAASPTQAVSANVQAEQRAAKLNGIKYVSTTAWVCAAKCEPIVGDIRVYNNQYHFGAIYTAYLSEPLQQALGLGSE